MLKKTLFFLLFIISILIVVYVSFKAKYKYEVAQDYQYAIQNSAHTNLKVTVKQGKFQFNNPAIWDTGFIKLHIEATPAGHFAEPSVDIIVNGQKSTLTFERGVKGIRYINLPVTHHLENSTIQLKPHHLKIKDQTASVILFHNPKVKTSAKIMVIAPHPDDAEIAAFGLYSHHNSLIVTITAGEAGPHTYDEVYPDTKQHYYAKGKLRVWNSITVPMLGNILPEHAINLGYFDDTLQQMSANKATAVGSLYTGINNVNLFRNQNLSSLTPITTGKASWPALVEDLKELIQKFNPDIIVTPYPALDWHNDHKFSTLAAIDAIKQLGLQQGQLFLYTNHLSFNNYYPYGAQGELISIPPDFNQSLYFDSLYSFMLATPKEKIFALDAMNDLRLDTSWQSISGAFKVFKKALENKLLYRDQTYFRRAVRANELFLVVNFSSLYNPEIINCLKSLKVSTQ